MDSSPNTHLPSQPLTETEPARLPAQPHSTTSTSHQQSCPSPPEQTVASYIALTTEAMHQQNAQRPPPIKSPKRTPHFRDVLDTLDIDLPSPIQDAVITKQILESPLKQFQVYDTDPFSQYTTTPNQPLNAEQVTPPVLNRSSWIIKNEHNYGASSSVAVCYGDDFWPSQDDSGITTSVTEEKYYVWLHRYTQDAMRRRDAFAGVGAQFDSYMKADDVAVLSLVDTSFREFNKG